MIILVVTGGIVLFSSLFYQGQLERAYWTLSRRGIVLFSSLFYQGELQNVYTLGSTEKLKDGKFFIRANCKTYTL